jgi:hypothetical protein
MASQKYPHATPSPSKFDLTMAKERFIQKSLPLIPASQSRAAIQFLKVAEKGR